MSELEHLLAQYDYPLSPTLIAIEPASPRDSAKLLVYDRTTGGLIFDTFLNLDKHLPPNALNSSMSSSPCRFYSTQTPIASGYITRIPCCFRNVR